MHLTIRNPTSTLSILQAAEKRLALDPENQDGGLQENGFSSLFSSLRFRMNRVRHKHDIIYPKERRMEALAMTS